MHPMLRIQQVNWGVFAIFFLFHKFSIIWLRFVVMGADLVVIHIWWRSIFFHLLLLKVHFDPHLNHWSINHALLIVFLIPTPISVVITIILWGLETVEAVAEHSAKRSYSIFLVWLVSSQIIYTYLIPTCDFTHGFLSNVWRDFWHLLFILLYKQFFLCFFLDFLDLFKMASFIVRLSTDSALVWIKTFREISPVLVEFFNPLNTFIEQPDFSFEALLFVVVVHQLKHVSHFFVQL